MATVTATYPDALQATLDRAMATDGPTVVDYLVTNWLKDRQRMHEDLDVRDLKEKLQLLTPADRASVLADIEAKKPK